MPIVKTIIVPASGVGRKDYSVNVENAVEPLIRSWQSPYNYSNVIHVPAGATVVTVITITSAHVIIIYDIGISCVKNSLLGLSAEAYQSGVWARIIGDSGYQKVKVAITAGFPLFQRYRVTIINYGDTDLDIPLNVAGIETSEEQYYLIV